MLNRNALKAEIVRKGMTQKELAKQLGIAESTLNRKIQTGGFYLEEADALIRILDIQEPSQIFFAAD